MLYNGFIDQSCVDGLVHLLNNSSLTKLKIDQCYFSTNELFDDLITAITNSELKQLVLEDLRIDLKMRKSLARLLTQRKTEVTLHSWYYKYDCCRLLDMMTQSIVIKSFYCRETVHVYSLGDRITLFPQFKYYYYYKHNTYYYIRRR